MEQGALGLPHVLDHYRIIEKIGAGGMGEVYRARDEHLQRDVAIKVLPAGMLADESARKRFRKEAEALSRLDSAHIATVHDFGTQDGVDFLVMEYIAGPSLAELMAQGPLPQEQIVIFGTQLAAGLHAAHEQGVVHRDIKPANLRLAPDGRLKILDFGLAKLLVTSDAATETFATGAQVIGTLAYMAPEQVEGKPADARTDIFAAGVVLYEMATGRLPYEQTATTALIDGILRQLPPAPSKFRPGLNLRLEEVILKCLEKSPTERYGSAQELQAALNAAAAKPAPSGVSAVLRTGLRTARRGVRTFRRVRVSAPTAVVAAILVIAFWLFGSRPALSFSPTDSVLVADFDNQTGDAGLDASLQTAFNVSLQQSRQSNLFPRSRVQDALRRMGKTGVKRMDEAIGREICVRENVRALLTVTLSKVGARYVVAARLIDPNSGEVARAFMERAKGEDRLLDAVGSLANDVRQGLGESLYSIQKRSRPLPQVTTPSLAALKSYATGSGLWYTGQYREAVQLYESAVQQDPDFAMAHEALAIAYYSYIYNDVVRGKQHCDKALALTSRTTDRERMVIQCSCLSAQHHFDDAIRAYQVLLQVYPNDPVAHYNFANLLRDGKRHQEAIAHLNEALRLLPNDPNAYINLATSYIALNNIPEALKYYGKAFEVEPQWMTSGNLSREYGFTLVQNGEEEKAITVFRKTLETPYAKMHAQRSLALLDFYHGRYRNGLKWLDDAVVTSQAQRDQLGEARNHLFLAIGREALGQRTAALNELAATERCLSNVPPNLWLMVRVGSAYARLGAVESANRVLQKSAKLVDEQNPANRADLHRLQGDIELARHNYARATELLALSEQENPAALALEGLATAQRATGNAPGALASYSALLNQRSYLLGWEAQQPWTVAHYSAASLYASQGDKAKAAALLDELLARWRDADPDVPLLKEARRLRATL